MSKLARSLGGIQARPRLNLEPPAEAKAAASHQGEPSPGVFPTSKANLILGHGAVTDGKTVKRAPDKAVIAAGGLGTRLLPATKEQPKEMLPVFARSASDVYSLKPIVQFIFEQLHSCGIRKFCLVVGRGKRAIEDHFTPDPAFEELLVSRGQQNRARELHGFYEMIRTSSIQWITQPEPLGFGDAVARASSFANGEPVVVHAGDNHVISNGGAHIKRLTRHAVQSGSEATLLLRRVKDPRMYGVAEVAQKGGELIVKGVEEKPLKPKSSLALLPTYVFSPAVFDKLKETRPGKDGEVQLTDAIQRMIDDGLKVTAVRVWPGEFWLDVGTPETYWDALRSSHRYFGRHR
jgi:UTP--glucose-1-phosphate uridylyltransferase